MTDEDACFGLHLAAEGMAAEGMAAEGLAQQFRQLGVGLWLRQKMPYSAVARLCRSSAGLAGSQRFISMQRLPACR